MTEELGCRHFNKMVLFCIVICATALFLIGLILQIVISLTGQGRDTRDPWIIAKDLELNFSEGFYYPLQVDMVKLAIRRINNESLNEPIINDHPFSYLHNPKLLCNNHGKDRPLRLMILVKSSVQYYQLRIVIRKTWGKKILQSIPDMKYAFLLGHAHNLQYIVDIEQEIYNDIIQEDFHEAYRNNTYKTIMGFNWIVEYCNQAQYVLFLDDDMYLNLNMLTKYLTNIETTPAKYTFTGICALKSPPVRWDKSKHYVALDNYPYNVYPDYLAGSSILASFNVIQMFQAVFPYVHYLPIDDSYLGIVAHKLNITPVKNELVENDFSIGIKNISNLVALHGFREYTFYLKTFYEMEG